jgi:glutathione S-transferase
MLTLYATDHSLYCAKTRILLRHKGLEFTEEPPVGGGGSDAYKQIVPSGNLPALVHGDLVLSDSEAIAEYIEEAFPDPPMLPRQLNARAKARERSRFHDTRLEPALRALFPIVKAGGGTVEQIDAATDGITARLAQLSRMLEDPLAPTGMLTLGDCGLPVTFDWIDAICGGLKAPIEWPERVTDYRAWLDTVPAVKAELEARHPIMREWVDARLG